jgi:SAM-dependent methyltransferase
MGLDVNAVQFLIAARKSGVEFGDVVMLGRQDLNVYPAKMKVLLESHGFSGELFAPDAPDTGFAEPVFKSLGAKNVYAMDFSDFEGAEFVHDLNQPLPDKLKQHFDMVYDGGTLEHVFHFPQALKNCMEMVRPGGRVVLHTIANNWMGHGFYQFSPELFWHALGTDNGYVMERMIAHIVGPFGRWFEVSNPDEIRSRVGAITFAPLHLLVQARRTGVVPVFAKTPQQSDYSKRWENPEAASAAVGVEQKAWSAERPFLAKALPGMARLVHVAKMGFKTYHDLSMRNRRNFKPVKRP